MQAARFKSHFYKEIIMTGISVCQSGDFGPRELCAAEVEKVNGGALPAVVYAGIKWGGGAFAAGFVGKAGADLYDYLFGGDS
jgi:hypothetical protein